MVCEFEIRFDCYWATARSEDMGTIRHVADAARSEEWASSHKLNETTKKSQIGISGNSDRRLKQSNEFYS